MDWLNRFTDSEADSSVERTVWCWMGLSFASDGRGLIAVQGGSGANPMLYLEREPRAKWVSAATEILGEAKRPDAIQTTLGDLWAWLDCFDRVWCEQCVFPGQYVLVADDFPCIQCSGRGWFPLLYPASSDANTVCFNDVHINRNLLAWWLAAELGTCDSVAWYQTTRGKAKRNPMKPDHLTVFGDTWKVFVCGLENPSPSVVKGRTYRTYIPGAGLAYASRRENWHSATDWFFEQGVSDLTAMWGDFRPDNAPAEQPA